MKVIILVILGVIVNTFYADSSAVNVTKKSDKPNEDDYKTKFTDLNGDCLLEIFEYLHFPELLNLAQIGDEYSTLAADVFRHKYSVSIDFHYLTLPTDPNELLNVAGMEVDNDKIKGVNAGRMGHFYVPPKINNNIIEFSSSFQILNTFKHFGHAIKKFKAIDSSNNRIPDLLLKCIAMLISKYSSESLVDLEFNDGAIKLLEYIEIPFINVENSSFDQFPQLNKNISIGFDRLFPSVRRLNLGYIHDERLAYFDYHLPHLKHLSMFRDQNEAFPVPGIIRKNKQIRSLELRWYDFKFVKLVSRLPQLRTLKLSTFDPWDESIEFKKVTTFELGEGSLTNLHFPRIENLHFTFVNELLAEYRTFLNEHNHLSHLYFIFYEDNMKDSELQLITANLPALVKITLDNTHKSFRGVSSAAIVTFLNGNASVKQLNFINWPDKQKAELQDQLKNEWKIRISNIKLTDDGEKKFDMCFKRKTIDLRTQKL